MPANFATYVAQFYQTLLSARYLHAFKILLRVCYLSAHLSDKFAEFSILRWFRTVFNSFVLIEQKRKVGHIVSAPWLASRKRLTFRHAGRLSLVQ
jgi:hypothetical protein